MHQIRDIKQELKILVVIEFESIELLKVWSSSNEHQNLLQKLEPYMEKEQKTRLFDVIY